MLLYKYAKKYSKIIVQGQLFENDCSRNIYSIVNLYEWKLLKNTIIQNVKYSHLKKNVETIMIKLKIDYSNYLYFCIIALEQFWW